MAKASTKKAAPAKKDASKQAAPVTKKAAAAAVPSGQPQGKEAAARVAATIANINAAMGGHVVQRASQMDTSSIVRRPTGILSIDIALGGGWPSGSLSLVTGPDGAGKDYLLNCTIAQLQKNYGEDCRVAIYSTEFPYDKTFARDICGVKVASTDEELADIDAARAMYGAPLLTPEERAYMQEQIGEIYLIQGVTADHGLDAVLAFLEDGLCQLIAINSLGVFETEAKENTESLAEFAQQSSEAALLSRFMPKVFACFNKPTPWGTRNRTTILATNQVRAKRDGFRGRPGMPVPEHAKYTGGSGAWALKHGKAIDLTLHKGTDILDKSQQPPVILGKEIKWELVKGKFGTHEGIKGHYNFMHGEGADIEDDLLAVGLQYGVIESAGAWYSYRGEKVHGVAGIRALLRKDPELRENLTKDCLVAAKVFCRYHG